jgi:hypothetical protein
MNLRLRRRVLSLCVSSLWIASLLSFAVSGSAQTLRPPLGHAPASCAQTNLSSATRVHAPTHAGPYLNLCDGHAIEGDLSLAASPRPLSLASGDFDEDGVPDLVSGFATGSGGSVTLHRGNVAALWPYGAAVRNGTPAPFFSNARTFSLAEAPDFLVVGDFDADGHFDVITARRGGGALWFLRGDGHGGFAAAQRIALPGTITAIISGEINRIDGLADLVVGLNTPLGPQVQVYESPAGAIKAQPETFKVANPVTALALGHFDGTGMNDLAIGAGDQLVVVHARDRKLSVDAIHRTSVPAAQVTTQQVAFKISAIVAGDFAGAGPSIAALGDDGEIHVLEHTLAPQSLLSRMVDDPSFSPTFQARGNGKTAPPAAIGSHIAPSLNARVNAIRRGIQAGAGRPEWAERGMIPVPAGFSQSSPLLIAARVTGSMEEDILAPDAGNNRLHVFSTIAPTRRPGVLASGRAVTRPQMHLLDSLESEAAPAAVLPMRLGRSGLQGLVMLQEGSGAPIPLQQNIPPENIFTVTNTSDQVITESDNITTTGPAGSLRKAMADVQAASGANGGGQYEIDFNIPTTDPGYNAATGTFLIQPLSLNAPNGVDGWALSPIGSTVTIDGYTQPGASPNTLATGDNAKILIRIDGALATTPGGVGLAPFDDANSTYRGFDFTGWSNPLLSNGDAIGGMGIEADGVGDYIEGNFFGTDPTGTLAIDPKTGVNYANRLGVFGTNGPAFGNMAGGNILGGTTPQARNILSNNQVGGALFLSTCFECHLEGNFIGLDASGAKALPNTDDGTGSNGPTVTLGGTLPGDGNVISSNANDIDFNDITNGGQASDSIAQGNLVGTDATGTTSVSYYVGAGASITSGATNETIGGTTPAARNVISGNTYGVYMFDFTANNIVQGNFIGTDVTGTQPIGNLRQGVIQGATSSNSYPEGASVIGGQTPGAGNLISGNGADGISITGTVIDVQSGSPEPNIVEGNLIGTDVTGAVGIPNGGNGISLLAGASSNVIGGADAGAGNTIAHNTGHGVLIDSASNGLGNSNNTIGNAIFSNGGAGVRINSGADNRISQNSIYQNGALGIDIGATGPNANTNCNSTNTGANNSQNFPVLTAGAGTAFFTATATDPSGNTSEFSQAVASSSGNMLDLLGNFNSLPNTNYTIEFFSSATDDASGYGQGQTYLGSTQVTTGSDCNVAVSHPVTPNDADVSISLSVPAYSVLDVGPDFGVDTYTATVQNLGPATAHNVVVTDVLPSSLAVSSLYCNVGPCQSPVTSSAGNCTVQQQTVTCSLGTLAAGQTAEAKIPVQVLTAGSITNTATAAATETDPVLSNNTSSLTQPAYYPFPFIDYVGNTPHVNPDVLLAGGPDLPLAVYGINFLPSTAISFNGTTLPTLSFIDNQSCGDPSYYCAAINVVVPAALLATAGTASVTATNPDPQYGGSNIPNSVPFYIESACTYSPFSFLPTTGGEIESDGTPLIPEFVEVDTNVPTCSWTASSSVPWVVPLEDTTQTGVDASISFAVAPNSSASPRSGSITVAGQEYDFTQDAASACDYTLGSTSANYTSAGGSGSIAVTPIGASCAPFVDSYATWITIPSNSGLLIENAPALYTVAANSGAARSGKIMIGGYVFTVNQAAPPCYYSVNPGTALLGAAGGSGSFTVTASSSTCAWTAKPSDASLVSVTSGASGTGNGTVQYTVPANTEGPQTPTINVSDTTGGSVAFAISQASPYTCTFTLSPSTVHVAADGTSNFISVNASESVCKWTTASSDPSSLTVTVGSSGSGNGTIYYAVGQNTSSQSRTLTLTAGCTTFTVNQDGTDVSNPVPAITTLQPSGATAGSGAFTLTVNGSGFVSGSVVNFGGNARATTYVSATQLTAAILATDIASTGTPSVTVTNPSPGGGTSNSVTFTISAANNPVPAIAALQPSSASAGSGAFTLTINGSGFVAGSVVKFGGTARTTTYVSATQLTAAILATDIASAGTPSVTVTNPAPGGGTSNAVTFTINAANNPVPAIAALQPSSANAGSGAFTLTVNGSGFINGSAVNFGGTARTTTYVSATQLTAAILATDIASAGTPSVTVTNPSPGGGISNAVTFTINAANNPVPAIATLQPSSASAGSGAFTLTINGSGFVAGSAVKFGGTARTTTYVSATQLTAAILAADVASTGTPSVTVTNPSPGGGISNSVTFTINAANNPLPAITTLSPSSTTAGSSAFALTVNGSNFVAGSQVIFSGNALSTTYVSANQLTATIPSALVASAGTPAVTVTNPSPGGGTSNAVSFTINAANNPVPTLTTLAPSSTTAGSSAFALTVNGSGFVSGSIVNFGGTARATTYVSATQLTAAILAADVASAGTPSVTVTNPTPGGGTSNGVTFTVNTPSNPVPAITTLAPSATTAGSAAFTLTVNGSGFISGSVVNFGGSARTTTYVSATQLTAAILAADVATAGAPSVTVTNSSPGGGTSNGVPFTVNTPPAPTFALSGPTGVQTVHAGGSAQYTITATAQNGAYTNPVTFSASGLPTGATASFQPSSITPGSTSATTQLTIQLPQPQAASFSARSGWPFAVSMLSLAGLFLTTRRARRRWVRLAVFALACLGGATAFTGCNGGFFVGSQTTPQNYTVTVTGTSGALQQTTTVQLTVE